MRICTYCGTNELKVELSLVEGSEFMSERLFECDQCASYVHDGDDSDCDYCFDDDDNYHDSINKQCIKRKRES